MPIFRPCFLIELSKPHRNKGETRPPWLLVVFSRPETPRRTGLAIYPATIRAGSGGDRFGTVRADLPQPCAVRSADRCAARIRGKGSPFRSADRFGKGAERFAGNAPQPPALAFLCAARFAPVPPSPSACAVPVCRGGQSIRQEFAAHASGRATAPTGAARFRGSGNRRNHSPSMRRRATGNRADGFGRGLRACDFAAHVGNRSRQECGTVRRNRHGNRPPCGVPMRRCGRSAARVRRP